MRTLFRRGRDAASIPTSDEIALWVAAYRASVTALEAAARSMQTLVEHPPDDLHPKRGLEDLALIAADLATSRGRLAYWESQQP